VIRLAVLTGVLLAAGLLLIASALRREPPPRLEAMLARLRGEDPPAPPASRGGVRSWAGRLLADRLAWIKAPRQDLALMDMPLERLAEEKIGMAALGLFLPSIMAAVLVIGGAALPWTLPAGGAVLLAVGGWFIPDATLRSGAQRRRADFKHALSAYLDFVRLALRAGKGPNQALESAPGYSGGWVFEKISAALAAAQHARIPPWEGLARLGRDIGVDELVDLADLAQLAGSEGTEISTAISAYTTQMRQRRLADLKYEAGARTTTMSAPIAILGLTFIAMVGFPQIYQLLNG
jgi:Flp pilus assembly protein TadB